VIKMPNELHVRIRKFIEKIGQLKETLHDPNIDFGFRVLYPGEKGRTILIVKPKKKNVLELQTPTTVSPEHIEKLDNAKKKELFSILSKLFILKEIHHSVDFKHKRYTLICKYHFEDESKINVDKLHNYIRKIFFVDIYAIGIVQEFVSGRFKSEDIEDHEMHEEYAEISAETAAKIKEVKANGNKVVAVGTTVTRTLESAVQDGQLGEYKGWTDIFIYPGYEYKVIDSLITNFHLPKSTLIMMVSALAGKEFILKAYKKAVEDEFRFFSLGDAMLILNRKED